MRVTKEQAKEATEDVCNCFIDSTGNPIGLDSFASDLLDARELIKEMHNLLSATINHYDVLPQAKSMITDALARTKEYAE